MMRGAQRSSLHRSQHAGSAHNANGFPLHWCGNGSARGPGAVHAAALPTGLQCLIIPGTSRRRSMRGEFYTNEAMIQAAYRRLAQGPWDYLSGGTESATSLRRNRLAFDRLALRPRVRVDVSTVDRSTTFLGHRLRTQVMLAPIGG